MAAVEHEYIPGLHMPRPDEEFAAKCEAELRAARERAMEVMEHVEPKDDAAVSLGKRGQRRSAAAEARRERVLHDVMCGYTNAEIAEREHVHLSVVVSDLKMLVRAYNARTIRHLVALATFDLGFHITHGKPFPDGTVKEPRSWDGRPTPGQVESNGDMPLRAKPKSGYKPKRPRGYCALCGREALLLKDGTVGTHSPILVGDQYIQQDAPLSKYWLNGWCIGSHRPPQSVTMPDMQSKRVTVGVTATLLADQGGEPEKLSVLVQNTGAVTVYIGGADVTTANGYDVPAAGEDSFELGPNDKLYGVVASGTSTVEVLIGGT